MGYFLQCQGKKKRCIWSSLLVSGDYVIVLQLIANSRAIESIRRKTLGSGAAEPIQEAEGIFRSVPNFAPRLLWADRLGQGRWVGTSF